MAQIYEIKVDVCSRNDHDLKSVKGSISKIEWNKKEKLNNAFRTLGMWLLFSFASVFVPIAHYFLVPTLFILAFVFALDRLSEQARSLGGTAPCPKCKQTFKIEGGKWSNRYVDTCEHCHDDLEIKNAHCESQ